MINQIIDIPKTHPLSDEPEARGQRIGKASTDRARWLLDQLTTVQPISELSPADRMSLEQEWAAFLQSEGLSERLSSKCVIGRSIWIKRLQEALQQLKEFGEFTIKYKAERTWGLSVGRVTSTSTVARGNLSRANEDESSKDQAIVLTMALECLARHYRFCLREKCKELFLGKGKKKYCSNKCARTVAKRSYRKRKQVRGV